MSYGDRNQKDMSRLVMRLRQKLPRSAGMRKQDQFGKGEAAVVRMMEQNHRKERRPLREVGYSGRARWEGQTEATHAMWRESSSQTSSKLSFL